MTGINWQKMEIFCVFGDIGLILELDNDLFLDLILAMEFVYIIIHVYSIVANMRVI